jgi:hypothetical protein
MSDRWFHIVTRDKPGLLIAMMRELAGAANISFEGDLQRIDWNGVGHVDESETSLQRQTLSPELDFVVLKLTEETQPRIWNAVCKVDRLADDGIIHIQIEKGGRLVFGAYDNFHADCVSAHTEIPQSLLQDLKDKGVIRSYGKAEEA